MAKETKKIRICDTCGERKEDVLTFGGSPFQGWIILERIDGHTIIPRSTNNGPWDFCCKACAIKFLQSLC